MNKRILHAANTILTREQTVKGLGIIELHDTVNESAHLVEIRGRSEQVVQEYGKNLLDRKRLENTDNYNPLVLNDGLTCMVVEFKVKPNTTYTFSRSINDAPTKNMSVLNSIGNRYSLFSATSRSIVTDKDGILYIGFIGTSIETSFVAEYTELQLEEGDTATEYEPFQPAMPSPEYPSPIHSVSGILKTTNNSLNGSDKLRESEIMMPELRAITDDNGNVIAEDVLYIDRKQKRAWVERKSVLIILNGDNRRVLVNGIYSGFMFYQHPLLDKGSGRAYVCNQSLYSKTVADKVYLGRANKSIYVDNSKYYDETLEDFGAADFEAYLRKHPLEIVTYRETPTIEELSYESLRISQHYTKITAESEVQPMIKVTANTLKIRGGGYHLLSRIAYTMFPKMVLFILERTGVTVTPVRR